MKVIIMMNKDDESRADQQGVWRRNFRHTAVPMNMTEHHCSISRTKDKGNYHQVQSYRRIM